MKRESAIFFVWLGMMTVGCSSDEQRQPEESFGFLLGTPDRREVGYSITATSYGEYVIIGRYDDAAYRSFPYIVKTQNNGDTIWTLSMKDSANISVIEPAADQGFVVAGSNYAVNSAIVMKIGEDGNIVWKRLFLDYTGVTALKPTQDGGYIVLITGFKTTGHIGLIKLDVMGNLVWEKRYESRGGYSDVPKGLETFGTGYLLLINTIRSDPGFSSSYIISTDLNGDTLWTKKISEEIGYTSFIKNNKGQLLLSGNGGIQKYNKFYLLTGVMKLDSNGTILMSKAIEVRNYNLINSVAETNSGEYLLAGNGGNYGSHAVVMKCDSTGNWLWSKLYSRATGSYGFSMKSGYDGHFVIVGTGYPDYSSNPYYYTDIFVFTIDANGNVIE